jgi:HK97 family phage major capsid protein
MSEVVKRLLERRTGLVNQMREVAERAVDENRDMTAEEDRQFTEMNAEVDALEKRADAMLEGEKRAKEIEDSFATLSGKPQERKQGGPGVNAELRAFLRGEPGAPRTFEVKPDGPVNFRDLSKLSAGAGANTVPTSFYDRLVTHLIENAALLRGGATVLNTSSGENIQIPKTTSHSTSTPTVVAETGTIGESDPVFGQITLGAFKYANMIQVSRELVDDSGVDLEGYLAMQAGRAIGNQLGAHLATGDGTAKPRGITIDTTLGVTGGTTVGGAFTGDDLIDLLYSVIEPYRMSSSASWLMRDATVGKARKLKGTDGQYLWQPGLQAGAPDLLLGKPILTDPNIAAVGLSAKSVVFGDLSQYFVRLAGGVRFERSDDFAFGNDLVSFRAIVRGDGALVDLTGAVKHFVGGAS